MFVAESLASRRVGTPSYAIEMAWVSAPGWPPRKQKKGVCFRNCLVAVAIRLAGIFVPGSIIKEDGKRRAVSGAVEFPLNLAFTERCGDKTNLKIFVNAKGRFKVRAPEPSFALDLISKSTRCWEA